MNVSEKRVMDSGQVADEVASSGTMAFYLKTLRENPKKIIIGVLDSIFEVVRFVFVPRFPTKLSIAQRASLIVRWAKAEVGIPGGTTVLETIWLTYAAARAKSPARSWVEVGCFKGLSTARLSMLCAIWHKQLYAYDTFTGLPGSDAVYRAVDNGGLRKRDARPKNIILDQVAHRLIAGFVNDDDRSGFDVSCKASRTAN